jgi:EAL domain-containing protein (putative c-di-GMP-specific phosphodiesterase class I)
MPQTVPSLERRTFPAGAPIFREGEPGRSAYIVEHGRVEIVSLRDGKSVRLAVLGEREIFGEMALVDDQLRSASAVALEETRVVVVSRDRVRQEMSRADPLLQLLLRAALDRVRTTSQRVIDLQQDVDSTQQIPIQGEPTAEYRAVRDRAFERLALEDDLRRACQTDELELWYQPIVGLVDRGTVGFEALIRWRHPERGVLRPDTFIPIAEATGLIRPLGQRVIELACSALARLDEHLPGVSAYVTMNLAAQQLADPNLARTISDCLEATGAPPDRLVVEITESELMESPEVAKGHLTRLRDLGLRVFLDDFGTGYSSLSYLHRFPVTGLKLDRSFTQSILGDDPVSEKIVRTVAFLARQLDLGAVAEGIEEERQAEALTEMGFRYGQGYLFSEPRPGMGAEGEAVVGG